FEVVDAGASVADVAADADLVVVAREKRGRSRVSGVFERDTASAPALTQTQRDVLALLADGLGNKQIAARLGISTNTVKTHLELLFERLGVASTRHTGAGGGWPGVTLS